MLGGRLPLCVPRRRCDSHIGAAPWAAARRLHRRAPPRQLAARGRSAPRPPPRRPAEPAASLARHQAALEAAARELDGGSGGDAASGEGPAAAGGGSLVGGGVRYWSDYLKAQLHPRSFQAVPGVWAGGPPFDGYGAAAGLLGGAGAAVDGATDAVRWWAEQCDSMQGAPRGPRSACLRTLPACLVRTPSPPHTRVARRHARAPCQPLSRPSRGCTSRPSCPDLSTPFAAADSSLPSLVMSPRRLSSSQPSSPSATPHSPWRQASRSCPTTWQALAA